MKETMKRFVSSNLANPTILNFVLNGKVIGKFIINNDKLEFVGDADGSVKIFLDKIKPFIDNYIKEKLEMRN